MDHMRLVLLFICSLGVLVTLPSRAAPGKPQPPVTVSIDADAPSSASDRSLVIRIRTNTEVKDVTAAVQALEGTELLSGNALWKGNLAKDAEHAIPILVRQTKPGRGSVRAVVTISGDGSPAYTAVAEFSLSGKPAGQRKTLSTQGVVRKDRRGKEVVEHPIP